MFKAQSFSSPGKRHQPDDEFTFGNSPKYKASQRLYNNAIGVVAIALPIAMLVSWRMGHCDQDSISHHYYAPFFGDLMVGALVFIGSFMIAYRSDHWLDQCLSSIAGLCAFFVAVFPASSLGCGEETSYELPARILVKKISFVSEGKYLVEPLSGTKLNELYELFPGAGTVHFVSAALLFAFLAYYSFCIFTRVKEGTQRNNDGSLIPVKRVRNGMYHTTGWVIVGCMAAIALFKLKPDWFPNWDAVNATFWFESVALIAFGFAWLVKGRIFGLLLHDEKPAGAT